MVPRPAGGGSRKAGGLAGRGSGAHVHAIPECIPEWHTALAAAHPRRAPVRLKGRREQAPPSPRPGHRCGARASSPRRSRAPAQPAGRPDRAAAVVAPRALKRPGALLRPGRPVVEHRAGGRPPWRSRPLAHVVRRLRREPGCRDQPRVLVEQPASSRVPERVVGLDQVLGQPQSPGAVRVVERPLIAALQLCGPHIPGDAEQGVRIAGHASSVGVAAGGLEAALPARGARPASGPRRPWTAR